MSFGGDADVAESARMYKTIRDYGINFIDCANAYSAGEAERILGRLIAGERDQLVITSKFAMAAGDGINDRGASRRHIKQAVEASLKRLGTDYVDILFTHRWDPFTPLEQTLRGLEDLVREGKVLYLGASNYSAWQVAKFLGISQTYGWTRFDVIQPMYNLVKRQAESEILPLALSEQLGVISYGPVGGGLLSGKYTSDKSPEDARLVKNDEYQARYAEPWVYRTAEQFCAMAAELNVHPVSLAVAWVQSNPAITCPIIGARNVEQLLPSLRSLDVDMNVELRDRISDLSREPALATDRLEERTLGTG